MSSRYEYKKKSGSMYLNNPIDQGQLATQFDNRVADEVSGTAKLLNRQSGEFLWLWIEDIKSDFAMSGKSAQSRVYNQFYPRSFNQPKFLIQGRLANDRQFNELAEFVRESQVGAIHYAEAPLSFQMPYRGLTGIPEDRIDYKRHSGWVVQGYIPKVQAGAKNHNPAPQFSFEYVFTYSKQDGHVGLFQDGKIRAQGREIMSWMEVIKNDSNFSGQGFKGRTITDDDDIGDSKIPNPIDSIIGTVDGIIGFG